MKYKSFRIQNFKGIRDTTVQLSGVAGANVFAFVGLNESGKTTVLEAIHSFSPDAATSELLGGDEGLGVPIKERVPRHLLSEFTGDVSVTATLTLSPEDRERICNHLKNSDDITINAEGLEDEIVFRRYQTFENGDFKKSSFELENKVEIKSGKQRKWREPEGAEKGRVRNAIYAYTPDIAYFPTFVFDFPESVFLTERGDVVDKFYRRVFQDILDYDGRGHTIEKDVTRRIRRKEMQLPWLAFWAAWSANDDREKIQHVMDRAGAAVTKLIFGRWNKIFGEDTRGKEVVISYDTAEGEREDTRGIKTKTQEHDIVAKFQIRDGTRRFNVNDRSLGFRWFFSFMLFTQFRVARSSLSSRPVLFLFDEPAANLHAAAQQKLIDSFPEIAKDDNVLAYSTHSHYMIEPKWLEQTFIVTNRSDDPLGSFLDQASLDDESLDVQVSSYRSFVNNHPTQTSYFQPILDRLAVVPSKFDLKKASVIVEGKSDYYIIRYCQAFAPHSNLHLLPGLGAGTFGALAALSIGWNLECIFLLDGDKQGNVEKSRYVDEYGISEARILTLTEILPNLKVIEDILDTEAINVIGTRLGLTTPPSKAQIRRFFQEKLASNNILDLGEGFRSSATILVNGLESRLVQNSQ